MPTVLYVLFALCLIPFLMAASALVLRIRQFGHLDNNHPRLQQADLRGMGARVVGAQANSWEALILFAVAVFIAQATGLPLHQLDHIAIAFLVLRLAYCVVYVLDWAWARTAVFAAGMACCIYVFCLAVAQAGGRAV